MCVCREQVEKLKASLLEVEESRSKLLDRAKRHVHKLYYFYNNVLFTCVCEIFV